MIDRWGGLLVGRCLVRGRSLMGRGFLIDRLSNLRWDWGRGLAWGRGLVVMRC